MVTEKKKSYLNDSNLTWQTIIAAKIRTGMGFTGIISIGIFSFKWNQPPENTKKWICMNIYPARMIMHHYCPCSSLWWVGGLKEVWRKRWSLICLCLILLSCSFDLMGNKSLNNVERMMLLGSVLEDLWVSEIQLCFKCCQCSPHGDAPFISAAALSSSLLRLGSDQMAGPRSLHFSGCGCRWAVLPGKCPFLSRPD